jgi:REP element-mobilizing transposase RayT
MRNEKIVPDQYYHLYNRGVNYGQIFFQEDNWKFFLSRLRRYFRAESGRIVAYCLMPNHYHLLVYVSSENFSTRVMQPFGISYTKAINKQQNRVGSLFQGPFQAKRVNDLSYLEHLSRYIHRNPVVAGLVSSPKDWIYSSYLDYIGWRDGSLPFKEAILIYFHSPEEYMHFVEEDQDEKAIVHLTFE